MEYLGKRAGSSPQEILMRSSWRNMLLDVKVQYKHKMKLPLDMVSNHVLLYLCFHVEIQTWNRWEKIIQLLVRRQNYIEL